MSKERSFVLIVAEYAWASEDLRAAYSRIRYSYSDSPNPNTSMPDGNSTRNISQIRKDARGRPFKGKAFNGINVLVQRLIIDLSLVSLSDGGTTKWDLYSTRRPRRFRRA